MIDFKEQNLEKDLINAKKMYAPDKTTRYFYKNEIKIPKNRLSCYVELRDQGKLHWLGKYVCNPA